MDFPFLGWLGRAVLGSFISLLGFPQSVSGQSASAEQQIDVYAAVSSCLDSVAHASNPETKLRLLVRALSLEPSLPDTAWLRYLVYKRFGQYLNNVGAAHLSILHQQRAITIREKIETRPSVKGYHDYGDLGSTYLVLGKLDSANFYYHKALNYARRFGDSLYIGGALNNIGLLYYRMGRVDSALEAYERAMSAIAPLAPDARTLAAAIRDNIAEVYEGQGKDTAAARLLLENVAFGLRDNYKYREIKSRQRLASIYLRLGRPADARVELLAAGRKLEPKGEGLDYQDRQLRGWIEYYRATGDLAAQLLWQQKLLQLRDSMGRVRQLNLEAAHASLVADRISRYEQELELHRLDTETYERRLDITALWGAIGVLAAALLLALLLWLRARYRRASALQRKQAEINEIQRRLAEEELERQRLEAQLLARSLEIREKDVDSLAAYLNSNRELNNRLMDQLLELSRQNPAESNAKLRELLNRQQPLRKLDDKLHQVLGNPKELSSAFFDRLTQAFPNLTSSEKELCALIRMRLSNAEIATIRNISQNSARMARYRLGRKLGLTEGTQLEDLLNGI